MRFSHFAIILVAALFSLGSQLFAQQKSGNALSRVTSSGDVLNTEKPWTYWWWMGSAVDEENIRYQIRSFADAGFGGVHIIPIYGVKGYEKKFVLYLSTRWISLLEYTLSVADEFGLGVDMTMGTGWPFGGPQITEDRSAKHYTIENDQFVTLPTRQMVKRAAPGGEGLVMDYFDELAFQKYVEPFDKFLGPVKHKLRSLYNDSYEVYGANWTNGLLSEFKKRRSYDLQSKIHEFKDTTDSEAGARIRMDYHQTLAELLHDNFTTQWTTWARHHSFITRNQAHGSPGNLIDLYALADIPETESFGTSAFKIPGLRVDENYQEERFGRPDPLAMRFATSAANLTGKKLVSSETGTWLGDHFKVSLSQVKPQIDELFTAGINHVFYHGITYSPKQEGFPGWLFYASTNFGMQSHLWENIGLLNDYVTRCQHLLQNAKPDNDVLVYFPINDLWSGKGTGAGGIHMLEVHHTKKWLSPTPFGMLTNELNKAGYSFDYVSDSLLNQLSVMKEKTLRSAGSAYKVIVVPSTEFMPLRTLKNLNRFADAGATVLFQDHLPNKMAGYLQKGSADFSETIAKLKMSKRVIVSSNIAGDLKKLKIRYEEFSSLGLSFIRKISEDGAPMYFIANLSNQFDKGWIKVNSGLQLGRFDPLTNTNIELPSRLNKSGPTEFWLELSPGQSCFLLPTDHRAVIDNHTGIARKFPIIGNWMFNFDDGVPAISKEVVELEKLESWTYISDSAQYFYGSGRYLKSFSIPDSILSKKAFMIDLTNVHEVATVKINGSGIGTTWSIPYRLSIPAGILQRENTIEIVVRNLSGNYMRLYDKLHPEWKKFYDINIVDIQYQPYDGAKAGVMSSGLIGLVNILYK
ncbi:MAG: glycosyl hydrolase [Chryseolinea sp.]